MNMMLKKTILLLLILTLPQLRLYSENVNTAVMNFSNETGGEGLAYISSSLADSLSATLSGFEDINIVERRQLSSVLDEIKLSLSGILDDESVSRAGELAKADVLILGSYTGNPEKITLTIKAINVESAGIIYGRVITAPLSSLFDLANQEIKVFASVISGKETGRVSVSSVPSEADIYIDGMAAGKTPLVEYMLPAGSHRLKIVLKGFTEEERTIFVETGKDVNISIPLIETRSSFPWTYSAGAMYRKPLNSPRSSDFESALEIPVSADYSFDRFIVSGCYSFSKMDHSQEIDSVFGIIEQTRWYTFHTFSISITYELLEEVRFYSPYAGLFLGGSIITDKKDNASYDGGWEKISREAEFVIGPKAGVTFFPEYKLRPYVEALFYFYPAEIIRKEYSSPGLAGALQASDESYRFYGISIGGGLRYAFR